MKKALVKQFVTICLLLAGIAVFGQDADFSELRLMKTFKGETVETTKKFPVSPGYSSLTIQIFGHTKSGLISITLIKPNGNKFKTIEIDSASDVNFEQHFDLKKNPPDITGDWQVKIQTDKADGSYHININTR